METVNAMNIDRIIVVGNSGMESSGFVPLSVDVGLVVNEGD